MSEKYYNQFNGIGKKTLPILVRPFPDEVLSSWIMRYSKELLTKSHTFCKFILKSENVWNRDVDLNASDQFIKELADKTFLNFDTVFSCTLRSYYPNLYVDVIRRWIIPIGVYHRTRKNAGQMFCPGCFKRDATPYYRRKWRLSLSVVCPDCQINLMERCPRCREPISFHRLEVGAKESLLKKDICTCHNCSFDFRKSKITAADPLLIEFQKKLYATLEDGYNDTSQYSHLYFDVVYQLCGLLTSTIDRFVAFDKELSKRSQLPFKARAKRNGFDLMRIDDRRLVLSKVNWLFENWPDRLITLSNDMHFYSSYLLKDFKNPPYWYWKLVMENTNVLHAPWRATRSSSYQSYNKYVEAYLKAKQNSQKNV